MSTPQSLAFFGATGECAGYCLASALEAGYICSALARTPAKLTAAMKAKGVSNPALDNLHIIPGDIRDNSAVTKALQINGRVVDTIVSGLGSVPTLQWSIVSPVTLKDPKICEDAAMTIVQALDTLNPAKKPNFIVVSTTGLHDEGVPRDIPLLYVPLYQWLLHIPHMDKANMERVMKKALQGPVSSRPLTSLTIVKPTLLMDGESRGTHKLYAGTAEKPAIGYFIRKSEVGKWMFENLVHANGPYVGKTVNLTA